jgi:hypothetical protein
MTPLAQWTVKNYTPEVRNVGLILILIFKTQIMIQIRIPRKIRGLIP